jgi:chitinase
MKKPLYDRILSLREKNPDLKILISIGGWFAKSTPFNSILTSNVTRNIFIANVMSFLRTHRFDGLGN